MLTRTRTTIRYCLLRLPSMPGTCSYSQIGACKLGSAPANQRCVSCGVSCFHHSCEIEYFQRYGKENPRLLCHKCFVADNINTTDLTDEALSYQGISRADVLPWPPAFARSSASTAASSAPPTSASTPSESDAAKAKAAEGIVKKAAKKAQAAAEKELGNKRICLEYERKEHAKQRGTVTSVTTPPKPKKKTAYVSGAPLLQKGDAVRVSSDYSAYMNSPGGDGIVTDVNGSGGKLTVDVQYDNVAAQKFEHGVPLRGMSCRPKRLRMDLCWRKELQRE